MNHVTLMKLMEFNHRFNHNIIIDVFFINFVLVTHIFN